MAHKFTEGNIFGFFGNDWKVIPLSKSRAGPIENVEKLMSREGEVGYSTNGFKVIEYLNKNKINVNRVLIFTDCQLYGGSINSQWQEYRKNINGDARLYLFDLSGYGTSNFPKTDKNVTHVGGWNDSVLRFINEIEKNPQAQVNYIKSHY